ncbi:hypothetical protein [Clostridium sp.]|uniref:hypothetical protein n=1 Tax=Clostridium sp. TaxID=1506 RepID=UPI003F2C0149
MAVKWTKEKIIEYVESQGYIFIEFIEYKGIESRILIQCDRLHEPIKVRLHTFRNKRKIGNKGCKHCKAEDSSEMQRGFTWEELIVEVEKLDFTMLSKKEDYKNSKSIFMVSCVYGHEFKTTTYRLFGQKCGCPHCSNRANYTNSQIDSFISKQGLILLSEYKNNRSPIIVVCGEGHVFKTTYASLISSFKSGNNGCPHCYGNFKYTIEYVREYLSQYEYFLLSSEYKDANSTIFISCKNNHIIKTTFSNFKNREYEYKCSACGERIISKGQLAICQVLNRFNVNFAQEYTFDDCKGKRRVLPFDFYLMDYNILIEYDGEQHYKYGCFGGDLSYLMNIQYLDNKKTQYCKDNNIKLIRIPYWDYKNIEEILCKELNLKRK